MPALVLSETGPYVSAFGWNLDLFLLRQNREEVQMSVLRSRRLPHLLCQLSPGHKGFTKLFLDTQH